MAHRKHTKAKASENPMDDARLMRPFREEQYDEETRLAMNGNLDALGESLGLDEKDFVTSPSAREIPKPEFDEHALEEDATTGNPVAER